MIRLNKKNKTILAGIGIIGGLGILYALLKGQFSFDIAGNRASIRELQSEHRVYMANAEHMADRKEKRAQAEEAAEWRRREKIWAKNVKDIEAVRNVMRFS